MDIPERNMLYPLKPRKQSLYIAKQQQNAQVGFVAEIITKAPFLIDVKPTSPEALQRSSNSRSDRKV